VQAPLSFSPGVAGSTTTPLRAQENQNGYESDYYDARSEVSDCNDIADPGDCEENSCTSGSPNAAEELLEQLRVIERRCRGSAACGASDELYSNLSEADADVECLLRDDTSQFWVCRTDGCAVVTVCAYFRLNSVTMEDAVEAIRIPKERLKWDGANLKELEILGDGDIEDPSAGQIVRCVVNAPRPLKAREMLQRRWQLPLPGGGQAFVLRSFDDQSVCPLRPDRYVRAFTHLSGYLLRPLDADGRNIELTMISRCDIGGVVPAWIQNFVRRLAKQEVVKFSKLLKAHCEKLASARAEAAARAARASQLRAVAQLRPLAEVDSVPRNS